jgi:hypothetical protein
MPPTCSLLAGGEPVLDDPTTRYWAAMAGVRLVDAPGLPAVGVFSDMSRPSAEALGFLPITRFTLWRRPRP